MTADTMDLAGVVRETEPAPERGYAPADFSPAERAEALSGEIKLLKARLLPQAILCAVLFVFTGLTKLGPVALFAAGHLRICSAALLVMQVVCCLLTPEVFIKSVRDLTKLKFDSSLLLLSANGFTALHALWLAASPETAAGLPFCAVSAGALLFFNLGRLLNLRSEHDYCLMIASSSDPEGVYRRRGDWDGGDVIIKCGAAPGELRPDRRQEDMASKAYFYLCPALLILVIVSSLIVLLSGAGVGGFLRSMSSLSSACCGFCLTLCLALPFSRLNGALKRSGASAASWDGLSGLRSGAGTVVSDRDLFPTGRITVTGMKIIGASSIEWALSATASVVRYAGSAMAGPFIELMNEQGGLIKRVSKLTSDTGGYSASVQGITVHIGTLDFMRRHSIPVHSSLVLDDAVYMATGDQLTAVYLITHRLSDFTVGAFERVAASGGAILASRDFCVDRRFMESRTGSAVSKCTFPDLDESGRLLSLGWGRKNPVGVVCREGIAPYAALLTGGRKALRSGAICLGLTLIAAILALEFMFFLSLSANFTAASAANLLLYCLLWLVPVLIIGSRPGSV